MDAKPFSAEDGVGQSLLPGDLVAHVYRRGSRVRIDTRILACVLNEHEGQLYREDDLSAMSPARVRLKNLIRIALNKGSA